MIILHVPSLSFCPNWACKCVNSCVSLGKAFCGTFSIAYICPKPWCGLSLSGNCVLHIFKIGFGGLVWSCGINRPQNINSKVVLFKYRIYLQRKALFCIPGVFFFKLFANLGKNGISYNISLNWVKLHRSLLS